MNLPLIPADPDPTIDAILDKWRTDPDQALIMADKNRQAASINPADRETARKERKDAK